MSVNEFGGYLSRDWNMRVGIGDHKNFRPVLGFVDEFRIYNYAVKKQEVVDMVNKCQFNGKLNAVSKSFYHNKAMNLKIPDNFVITVNPLLNPISNKPFSLISCSSLISPLSNKLPFLEQEIY